jgi:two-component system, LytTR family, sensor kinase
MTHSATIGPLPQEGTRPVLGTGGEPHAGVWRQWFRLWGWGFAAYTALGLMSAMQNAVNITRAGQAVDWPALLANRLLDNYGYALFVPPLFLLVRRFPLDRPHWVRSTPILLAATLAFVYVKCVFLEPLGDTLVPVNWGFSAHLFGEMYDIWSIVVVAQAIEFYRRAQERERQAVELRERLTHAQLEALRSQLHPHFLFNTLNGAATLMHTDVVAADRMLTQLSDLLRATLTPGGPQEIPLADELELLDQYLAIMLVRFRDRLSVTVDVAPEARAALVPQFLLQPLIENALEHGIGARPGPGRLEVHAARDGDRLRMTITDDGPGPEPSARIDTGIGLANTRARLAQLYGADQRLVLEPVNAAGGGGARVTVSLPFRPASAPS